MFRLFDGLSDLCIEVCPPCEAVLPTLTAQGHATIHQKFMAMDERGSVARQERRSIGDVVRYAGSGDRLQCREGLFDDIQDLVRLRSLNPGILAKDPGGDDAR